MACIVTELLFSKDPPRLRFSEKRSYHNNVLVHTQETNATVLRIHTNVIHRVMNLRCNVLINGCWRYPDSEPIPILERYPHDTTTYKYI